jgi:IS5 family transposase
MRGEKKYFTYKRFGYYPEAVLADKIYRSRNTLSYCKERGNRLSGPRLGRPSKNEQAEQKRTIKSPGWFPRGSEI